MFDFIQAIATKTVSVFASVIIAVGIVKMPPPASPIAPPQNKATPIAQISIPTTTVSSTTTPAPVVVEKKSDTPSTETTRTKELKKIQEEAENAKKVQIKAEEDAQKAKIAQQEAEAYAAAVLAQEQATRDAQAALLAKQAEEVRRQEQLRLQQEAEIKRVAQQQAEQEAVALREEIARKEAILEQIESECENPINALTQQILDVKTQYFSDVENLSGQGRGIAMEFINGQKAKLLNNANTKIQNLSNQIDQIRLQCSIKFSK